MFHLFNSIKVFPDFSFDSIYNIGGIGFITKFDECEECQGDKIKELAMQRASFIYESYDDVVGDGKKFATDLDFFKSIYLTKEFTNKFDLAVDSQTYATIVCKYIKMVLPKCNCYQAFAQYKLSLDWFYILYNFQVRRDNTSILGRFVNHKFKRLSEKEFCALFNKTKVSGDGIADFVNDIKDLLSIEYQMASVLLEDGKFDDRIYELLYKRSLETRLMSCREFIEARLYGLYRDNSYTDDVDEIIKNDATLAYIYDKFEILSTNKANDKVVDMARNFYKLFEEDKKKAVESIVDEYVKNVEENKTVEFLYKLQSTDIQFIDALASCEFIERLDGMSAKELLLYTYDNAKTWYNTDYHFVGDGEVNINLFLQHHIFNLYNKNKELLMMYTIQ